MRVLVTGGTGLVGRALCSIYDESIEWIPVSSKDANLKDLEQVRAMFAKHSPIDGVIHLAANVGGIFKHKNKPVEMIEDNLIINLNVIKTCHECNIQRLVCCLSTCIFPDPAPAYPITMDMIHAGPPHTSNEGYAYAKRLMEVQCRTYNQAYDREYFCVVPPNIYGPGDNYNLIDAHVVPALIHKCWTAKRDGTPLKVAGDGTPLRQFVYSDDLARIIHWAFKYYTNYLRPVSGCPPDCEVAISDVVRSIVDAFGFTGPIEYDPALPNGHLKKTVASDDLPHGIVFTPLREGIQKSVDWFIEHKDIARC